MNHCDPRACCIRPELSKLRRDLFESVYELALAAALQRRGLRVERQAAFGFVYEVIDIQRGLRVDLLVEDHVVLALKVVERLVPAHRTQLLTYLRLAEQPLGLLMNFGAETFKEGVRRVANNYSFAPSRLCVNPLPSSAE